MEYITITLVRTYKQDGKAKRAYHRATINIAGKNNEEVYQEVKDNLNDIFVNAKRTKRINRK